MTHQPARIDWFRVIVDLERAGLSHRRIGKDVGLRHGTIWRLKNGVTEEPNYTPALRLLALWVQKTGRPFEEAPRDSVRNLDTCRAETAATSTPVQPKEPSHGQARTPAERPNAGGPALGRALCAG